MSDLMLFPAAVARNPAVDAWFSDGTNPLRLRLQPWYDRIRACGGDVCELMHDFCPTACVGQAAFAYVNAFSKHANIGFYQGAALPDPSGLLEGTGKRMRHVKLHWGRPVDETAVAALIAAAYDDMRVRLQSVQQTMWLEIEAPMGVTGRRSVSGSRGRAPGGGR